MVTITIGGSDISSYVDWTSLRIENILTRQVDRCTFKIRNFHGKSYVPNVGQEVIITDGSTRVFGGVIVRRTDSSPAWGILEFAIECTDYTRVADQHLVAETYTNMTVNQIIADLVANFMPSGFTATQVDCDTTISLIQFKYLSVSSCIEQLANITGFDWYLDYFKDFYFQAPTANPAPITLQDNNGTFDNTSLVIRKDNSQMRNSIIVRGGLYEGTQFTASARMDGKQVVFNLPYKYHDFAATLTGHRLSLGVDYIDNPDSFDALYNFNEKLLRWKDSDRPNQNATLSFSGKPLLPVVVSVKDNVAIANTLSAEGQGDGEYQYVVVDASIDSQVAARERAAAEIRTYAQTLSEGEFTTETSGLTAGMQLTIDSDFRAIHDDFVINKVVSTMKNPTTMIYSISLITTKTMDFIAIIKKLLLQQNSDIVITDNELLDLTDSENESTSITDSIFTASHNRQTESTSMAETFTGHGINYGVQWVLGPQTPSGFKRQFILDGSRLS